jgi:hypothetical protein
MFVARGKLGGVELLPKPLAGVTNVAGSAAVPRLEHSVGAGVVCAEAARALPLFVAKGASGEITSPKKYAFLTVGDESFSLLLGGSVGCFFCPLVCRCCCDCGLD